ncbi:hypothetical protein N1708_15720 [Klebsiella pneumoniae]|uniref:hypothetical protein n=1 Tax=Klebsiella pneumoniae TaxID=573 RepID=UPI0021A64F93|nr:hypothetical protein [Klebsiella pneumoniae]EIX9757098.1 hypothetical protein [Klebsiella pneumoniae]MCP6705202.1 hypothetical protein [Klebsiella pneumoniae]MEC5440385.1 hypothetical protein [Klebsiella pneumoniae]UWT81019.1 hypothetical protein N1708_15720 [Klebsiella pneumoniae]HBW1100183.1 hypothetical protein [Klebsiella pneumoniae]
MTSKLTKEWLQHQISAIQAVGITDSNTLAAFKLALAAIDSEPLAVTDGELNTALQLHRLTVDGHSQLSDAFRAGFRYARRTTPQPAPVVSAELLHTAASAIEDLLTTKDRTGACVWFDLPFRLRSAANAQPVTVVPEEKPIPNTLSMYAVDAVAAIAEVKGE